MKAFFHFISNEWYFAIPMLMMSMTATALVIWRLLLNMNARTNLNEFLPQFQKKLETEDAGSSGDTPGLRAVQK